MTIGEKWRGAATSQGTPGWPLTATRGWNRGKGLPSTRPPPVCGALLWGPPVALTFRESQTLTPTSVVQAYSTASWTYLFSPGAF